MSTQSAPRHTPQVQHSFDGDVKVLNGTFNRRMEIRKALTTLADDLQKFEGSATQVKAEIKLRTSGPDPRQHVYSVTVTDRAFMVEEFEKAFPPAEETVESTGVPTLNAEKSQVNGQQAQRSPRPVSRKADEEDVVEIRPFKRTRTSGHSASPSVTAAKDQPPKDELDTSAYQANELLQFMKDWHEEWVRQGGWLFDNITKAVNSADGSRDLLQKKLDVVQDVLGQSLNSASASTMAELSNIAKLVPWLEHCRKSSADKVQAREEKWRTSSATFHDQTRREREAAEKRIEKKLAEQRSLLMKLAHANGVDTDDMDGPDEESPDRSREESLGAQLTAELNLEAERSGGRHPETISIDD